MVHYHTSEIRGRIGDPDLELCTVVEAWLLTKTQEDTVHTWKILLQDGVRDVD